MSQLDFTQNILLDPVNQISTQLADQLTPLFLDKDDDIERRKQLITFYIVWYQMIINMGNYEHSGDWDPAIEVTMRNGDKHGNEPGYDVGQIEGNYFNITYPLPDKDEEGTIQVPIMNIESISFYFH